MSVVRRVPEINPGPVISRSYVLASRSAITVIVASPPVLAPASPLTIARSVTTPPSFVPNPSVFVNP